MRKGEIIKCINAKGCEDLTKGKEYKIVENIRGIGGIVIIDDNNEAAGYFVNRFVSTGRTK